MSAHRPDETAAAPGRRRLLSAETLAQAQAHLDECPDCAALAEEYRELFGDLAALPSRRPRPASPRR